eukprot:15017055-Ditylum_brightwellii.AAC.1
MSNLVPQDNQSRELTIVHTRCWDSRSTVGRREDSTHIPRNCVDSPVKLTNIFAPVVISFQMLVPLPWMH